MFQITVAGRSYSSLLGDGRRKWPSRGRFLFYIITTFTPTWHKPSDHTWPVEIMRFILSFHSKQLLRNFISFRGNSRLVSHNKGVASPQVKEREKGKECLGVSLRKRTWVRSPSEHRCCLKCFSGATCVICFMFKRTKPGERRQRRL